MKPVFQRIEHDPAKGAWGDCHRAALASLLELPLSAVPHFTEGAPADWRDRERAWLAERGLRPVLVEIPAADQAEALRHASDANPDPAAFYLLSGQSSVDGLPHDVVCRGARVVHDVDPDAIPGQPALSGPLESGRFVACFMVPADTPPGMRAPRRPAMPGMHAAMP